jgi:hypothetical protein
MIKINGVGREFEISIFLFYQIIKQVIEIMRSIFFILALLE